MANSNRRRWVILALAVTLLLPPAWFWYNLLSPWGYTAPAGLAAIAPDRQHRLFVYGTLTHGWVRWLVTGEKIVSTPARLPGFRREGLDLVAAPTAVTQGELLEVSPTSLRRLDRYERLGIRYERVRLTLEDGKEAWVYTRIKQPPAGTEPTLTR